MTNTMRTLRVGCAGAFGGAINAWLCYSGLPVPVGDKANFGWHVIPAGAVHGALLAAVAFGAAVRFARARLPVRLAAAVPVAWLAGYVSWIPLNRSAFDESWSKSVFWPFEEWSQAFWMPFAYFGLVAFLYYLWLAVRGLETRGLAANVIAGCAAGVFGSLWWWISWERWYFSVLHGAIWGALAGAGVAGSMKGDGQQG
jgi:hypothetical protein